MFTLRREFHLSLESYKTEGFQEFRFTNKMSAYKGISKVRFKIPVYQWVNLHLMTTNIIYNMSVFRLNYQ